MTIPYRRSLAVAFSFALALGAPRLLAAQAARPWSADVAVGAASVESGHFFNDAGRAGLRVR